MPGLFDDLIPAESATTGGGMFDDLIPEDPIDKVINESWNKLEKPSKTYEEYRNQGYAFLPSGDPRRSGYDKLLSESVAKTNSMIGTGFDERYRDLPYESALKIKKRIQSGAPFDVDKAIALEHLRIVDPYKADILEEMGPIEGLAIGYQSGLRTAGRGIGLPADESNVQAERMAQEYGPGTVTAGKLAGEAVPFLVPALGAANIASLPVRASTMAALGGLEGGVIAKGEGGDASQVALSAALGAILGGGMEVVAPYVNRMARKLTGIDNAVSPDGQMSKEFVEALQKEGVSPEDFADDLLRSAANDVNPNQAARKAILESEGLTPTKAQITREATDFQLQQEAAKTSGRVRRALEGQEQILSTRFDDAVRGTGGTAATSESTITSAVVDKATALDNTISDLYRQAREAAPGDKVVGFPALVKKLRSLATSNEATDGAIKSVMGDLQNRGIVQKGLPSGRVSVEVAEEVRKGINDLYDPQKPFRNMKLRELKEALDEDVFRSSGDDIFKQARKAKADFEGELSRAKISKFDSRRANLVRDVLENKVDPDRFADQVVFSKKWRATDLKQLKDYVATDEAGKAAFDDLRANVLQEIKDRAFIGPIDEQGFQALSRDKLEKALATIGEKKIEVLFTPQERLFLKRILAISKLREPVRGTYQGKGPTAQAVLSLENKLRELPIMGSLVNVINIDAQGRAALRAAPKKLPKPGNPALSAASVGGIALAQDDE